VLARWSLGPPFRVFGSTAYDRTSPCCRVLSWNSPVVQSIAHPPRSVLIGLRSPFAVSHSLGRGVFRGRTTAAIVETTLPILSSTWAFPPESYPVAPSRTASPKRTQAAPLLGLCFPSTHPGTEGPLHAGFASPRYVPSAGFGYPLDGLLPSELRRAFFIPAAFLGFLPSKRSPLKRWDCVPATAEPACC